MKGYEEVKESNDAAKEAKLVKDTKRWDKEGLKHSNEEWEKLRAADSKIPDSARKSEIYTKVKKKQTAPKIPPSDSPVTNIMHNNQVVMETALRMQDQLGMSTDQKLHAAADMMMAKLAKKPLDKKPNVATRISNFFKKRNQVQR